MSRKELIDKRNMELNKIKVFKYRFLESSFDKTISAIHLDSPFGENLFEVIQNNIKIREAFSELIKPDGFKLLFDKSSKKLRLFKELGHGFIFEFSFSQIADTLQKLIFHLAACISNKDSILLFEEPEAHMFPPYISKLTSNIIYDENNNQYFIATHSPFVLNDFMEDMDKEDLSIYAIGLKDGATVIRRLSDEEITEVYQYGVDLFFNLEDYLKDAVT
jgi:predicted ATPase